MKKRAIQVGMGGFAIYYDESRKVWVVQLANGGHFATRFDFLFAADVTAFISAKMKEMQEVIGHE